MRKQLIESVKGKIADDCYENDLKLSVALDRLLDELSCTFEGEVVSNDIISYMRLTNDSSNRLS